MGVSVAYSLSLFYYSPALSSLDWGVGCSGVMSAFNFSSHFLLAPYILNCRSIFLKVYISIYNIFFIFLILFLILKQS